MNQSVIISLATILSLVINYGNDNNRYATNLYRLFGHLMPINPITNATN